MTSSDRPVVLDESGWEAINSLVRTKQITINEYLEIVASQAAHLAYAS